MKHRYNTVKARWPHHLANPIILILTAFLLTADTWAGNKRNDCDAPTARYETVTHAVLALSNCYLRQSVRGNREYMAALISDGEAIATIVGRGRRGSDQIDMTIRLKRGQALVAFWHVHGSNGVERSLFSPTDVALVKRLEVPFYLTDPTGFIWRLDSHNINRTKPEYSRITALRPPPGSVQGDAVGHMNAELHSEDSSTLVAACRPNTTVNSSPPAEMLC